MSINKTLYKKSPTDSPKETQTKKNIGLSLNYIFSSNIGVDNYIKIHDGRISYVKKKIKQPHSSNTSKCCCYIIVVYKINKMILN